MNEVPQFRCRSLCPVLTRSLGGEKIKWHSILRVHRYGSIQFTHVGHSVVNITIVVPQRREYYHRSFGQVNVDRSCRVIWSIVGVVCPAWSSGVDKACSSQCFDGLFVYFLLGCFEMLSSGRSIFFCSSWGQVEELNVLMRLSIVL